MTEDVMIDLETMSLAKDAAIISIGAVRFDLETGELGETFYKVVNLKSAQRAGGRIDAETVMWWLEQSEEARNALTGNDGVLIEEALKDFSAWLRGKPFSGLWGNGAGLDNVVLESAYRRLGWTPPWSYTVDRCYRTIKNQFPDVLGEITIENDCAHNALSDAIYQAKYLCQLWRLRGL